MLITIIFYYLKHILKRGDICNKPILLKPEIRFLWGIMSIYNLLNCIYAKIMIKLYHNKGVDIYGCRFTKQ